MVSAREMKGSGDKGFSVLDSRTFGLHVIHELYAVVMFVIVYTVWDCQWQPLRQDLRNLSQTLSGMNLENVFISLIVFLTGFGIH